MSAPKDDGGSAFPEIRTGFSDEYGNAVTNVYSGGGMSLRDYFAGQALVGLVHHLHHYNDDDSMLDICTQAYRYADTILEARGKP